MVAPLDGNLEEGTVELEEESSDLVVVVHLTAGEAEVIDNRLVSMVAVLVEGKFRAMVAENRQQAEVVAAAEGMKGD